MNAFVKAFPQAYAVDEQRRRHPSASRTKRKAMEKLNMNRIVKLMSVSNVGSFAYVFMLRSENVLAPFMKASM
jgi:hypothetical protein